METKELVGKVFIISFIYATLIALILWIFDSSFILSKSFILGSVTAFLGLSMMGKNSNRIIRNNKPSYAVTGYIFRFVLIVIILVFVYFNPESFNLYATFGGLFTCKVCMYGYLFVKKGVIRKNE